MSGKEIRMRRIFRDDGRTVISALDMGMFNGTVPGLEDGAVHPADTASSPPDPYIEYG